MKVLVISFILFFLPFLFLFALFTDIIFALSLCFSTKGGVIAFFWELTLGICVVFVPYLQSKNIPYLLKGRWTVGIFIYVCIYIYIYACEIIKFN